MAKENLREFRGKSLIGRHTLDFKHKVGSRKTKIFSFFSYIIEIAISPFYIKWSNSI